MSIILRIALIIFSVLTAAWMLVCIRKSKMKIEDSVFWLGFSVLLILLSLFPNIIMWGAGLLGIQGPQNFLFLVIIFILVIKLFKTTMRVSQLELKLQKLAQTAAIKEHDAEEKP